MLSCLPSFIANKGMKEGSDISSDVEGPAEVCGQGVIKAAQ